MQKKIIALAVAAALTAPAMAFAEVTVFGQANVSYDALKDGAVTTSRSYNQLNSNSSRLGFKGSDDLGSGLSAIFQMEAGVSVDSGQAGGKVTTASAAAGTPAQLFSRNTYLGLKSADFGTLMAGNNDTAYKTSTRGLDMFADGIADNRGNQSTGGAFGSTMMGGGHDARVTNALNYVSPNMGGFGVAVSTVFGAENAANVATADKKGSLMSLAATYAQGPLFFALANQTVKAGDAGTGDMAAGGSLSAGAVGDKSVATKLGGGFKTDAFAINAVYETIKSTVATTATETKGTNYYVGGKFNFSPKDAVKVAYTNKGSTKKAGTDNKDKATEATIGYDHAMSKATTVYALYSKMTVDNAAGTAADPSVISIGTRYAF